MINPRKELISSIFFLIVALVILIASIKASLGSFRNPESGLVPFLAALLLGIFSLLNLMISALKKGPAEREPIFLTPEINWKNLFLTLGALFAFPFLLNILGFNLTVFVFMLILLKTIELRRWISAIFFAIATTVVCYFIFVYWLKFVVEKGIFGI